MGIQKARRRAWQGAGAGVGMERMQGLPSSARRGKRSVMKGIEKGENTLDIDAEMDGTPFCTWAGRKLWHSREGL